MSHPYAALIMRVMRVLPKSATYSGVRGLAVGLSMQILCLSAQQQTGVFKYIKKRIGETILFRYSARYLDDRPHEGAMVCSESGETWVRCLISSVVEGSYYHIYAFSPVLTDHR